MKHWSKLAVALAVFALLLGVFAVAYAEPGAAPTNQTATPTPKPPPTVNTDSPVVPFLEVWQKSGHADKMAEAFRHWDQEKTSEVPTSCAKCHSSGGFQDFLGADGSKAGAVDKPAANNTVVDCIACHNTAAAQHDAVTFPSGVTLTGLGYEARCMECHQGRESTVSVNNQITGTFKLDPVKDLDTVVKPMVETKDGKAVTTTFGFRNVHYFAAAATQYGTLVKGGYEYDGESYDGKFQHPAPFNTCVGCHDQHAPELNIEQCGTCHQGVKTVEDLARDPHERLADGLQRQRRREGRDPGRVRGPAGEAADRDQGLRQGSREGRHRLRRGHLPLLLRGRECQRQARQGEKSYSTWTPRLLKAAYNYQVAGKDPGAFAHNAKYIIQLMHDSINDLNEKITAKVDCPRPPGMTWATSTAPRWRSVTGTARVRSRHSAPSAIPRPACPSSSTTAAPSP